MDISHRLLVHASDDVGKVALLLLGLTVIYVVLKPRQRFPPGPRGLPVIGNVHQIPTETPWRIFAEWRKLYGDIISINVMGKTMLVLNSRKVVRDLLEKRSLIYSDRPRLIFASEMVGYNRAFGLQNYGENWRQSRKFVAQDFGPSVVSRYWKLQEREAQTLIRGLLSDPSSLVPQVKWRIGSIIFRIVYGYTVESENDPLLHLGLTFMDNFSTAATAGNFLVDFLPALQYVPRWMPGAGFFKTADKFQKTYFDACYKPYEWCESNLTTGKALLPNLCANTISEASGDLDVDAREKLIFAANGVMGAGLETSMSVALTFFRAMVQHPEIQKKAHAEIDRIVGTDRLPSNSDRPNLPYLRSIMAEVFRYGPPAPLGIPHALKEDDIYEGQFLPKGSMILPNIWWMQRNPEFFDHPDDFNPDRYNGDNEEMSKVTLVTFGFGRRFCPGYHFAEATLFAIIATTLATCDILPGLDEHGNEIMPTDGYTSGVASFPEDFSLRLKPRSPQAEALLADAPTAPE